MLRAREARMWANLTQAELAELAGITPAMLCRIERGQANPTLRTLDRIANALGVSTGELFVPAEARVTRPTRRGGPRVSPTREAATV